MTDPAVPTEIQRLLRKAQELTREMRDAGIIRITYDPMFPREEYREIEVWFQDLDSSGHCRFVLNSLEGEPRMTKFTTEHPVSTGRLVCNGCGESPTTNADIGATCPAVVSCGGNLIEVNR